MRIPILLTVLPAYVSRQRLVLRQLKHSLHLLLLNLEMYLELANFTGLYTTETEENYGFVPSNNQMLAVDTKQHRKLTNAKAITFLSMQSWKLRLKVHSDCVRRRTTSLWGSSATPYDVVHVNSKLIPRSLCTVMNINEKKYGLPLAESLRRRTT
jgi:hypothetical protein